MGVGERGNVVEEPGSLEMLSAKGGGIKWEEEIMGLTSGYQNSLIQFIVLSIYKRILTLRL